MIGYNIYYNDLMLDTEEYYETIKKSKYERWILPIIHPITISFEPWIKTYKVKRIKISPSKNIIATDYGFVMHPIMALEFKNYINTLYKDMLPYPNTI